MTRAPDGQAILTPRLTLSQLGGSLPISPLADEPHRESPRGQRALRIGSRTVIVTPVFDTYWRFAHRRQQTFMRRVLGAPPPWTEDPILATHRFTNAYRASDRVSQYLIRHVIYEGEQTSEEIFFRTVLFKLFNRIDTWEHLSRALGSVQWRGFRLRHAEGVLDALQARTAIYSAAYIMPSPAFGAPRKHANHLRLLVHMMTDGAPAKIAAAPSLEEVFRILRAYPSLGDFLAFQLAIDLNYGPTLQHSEMDFVVAGPGARDGIRKCFADTAGLSEPDIIRLMTDRAADEFKRLGLIFQDLWGRPLQLIDCQNLFCEVGKYARVVHPEVKGTSGRTRIKQVFAASPRPVPQWYPPKWGLLAPSVVAVNAAPRKRAPRAVPAREAADHR
jgi:hypothetical protein